MNFSSRYQKLNAAQKRAVDTIDGPVMVIAGPGTGKTELLSMRAANILQKTDTLPENILCLTFTESGAASMRQRLGQIIGANAYKVAIHTFHSFGTDIINHNGQFFYHGAHFRAADELNAYEILRTIFDGLEYSNPLAGKMNGEYTHLGDTLTTISELKKSGLTSDELIAVLDANDHVLNTTEPYLAEIFAGRIAKTTAIKLASVMDIIQKSGGEIYLPGIAPLSRVLADSLASTLLETEEVNSTKPITAWRNTWLKKNDAGSFVFKSRERHTKLRAVSDIYSAYLTRMQESELYDFDDMILRVVHAMEVFPELRFNMQEKYQYIMVDEFQDTNLAQMRILYDLTSNEINNGRPNILVVGDDDQAIYSFQGADVGNISNFRHAFSETELITLTDNYRSSDIILSQARSVITKGSDRLENHIAQLNKTLTPHLAPPATSVDLVEHPTLDVERTWLIDAIQSKLDSGVPASQIAVLARRHHEIVELLPYFAHAGISVNYERRDNVLELDIIRLIEHVGHIFVALFEKRHQDADSMLPELLAHPAFGISPLTVWQLSLKSQQNHQLWMEVMAVTPELQPLHNWIIVSMQLLAHQPLEQMLDSIIGVPGPTPERAKTPAFISPIYEHYFSQQALENTPDAYLTYLEALRTIRAKLRDHYPEEAPTLRSFLEFIRLHRALGSTITSVRSRTSHIDAGINLMTAHKSKGLEFDHVYIVGAIDNKWGERVRSRGRLIAYPENLPLAPSGDTFDERLRLFFVAMTRARTHLTISYSRIDDKYKETLPASFLTGESWQVTIREAPTTLTALIRQAELAWHEPLVHPVSSSMKELLAPILETYKLSSTHFNNFLDVTRGGPQYFLMNNLLRFPQATAPSAGYGSAIHATLHRAHSHLTATGSHRPIGELLSDYKTNLRNQYLTPSDYAAYLQKGTDALTRFFEARYDTFKPGQKAELNFAGQQVYLEGAHLTGSLDLIEINDRSIVVTDYKTGKPQQSWTGKTDYEKIKLHRYRQQLMFYCLLIQHSRDYAGYSVEKSVIQFVEPTHSGEIISLEASFDSDELVRFKHLVKAVWQHIVTLDLPDIRNYDPSYSGILAFENDLLSSEDYPANIDV